MRKFYKTIIPLEILSDEPIGDREITDILEEATSGNYSLRVLEATETVMDGLETAQALKEQASDPSFFGLNDEGGDCDL